MKWSEILNEGRDAPLYHACGLSTAVQIIRSNALRGFDAPISLTRSLWFAQSWANQGVVFVLDQARLAQRFPIRPGDMTQTRTRRHEAEEIVPLHRPITPLDRYLTAICITHADWTTIVDQPHFAAITQHPLLKIIPSRTV